MTCCGDAGPQCQDEARTTGQVSRSRKLLFRILAILFVVAITASIFVFRDRVEGLETYGYLGAFLISLITSATIILPVPGIVLIAALGAVYNPVLIGLAAGAGSALGEITGYMAGYSGQIAVENNRTYQRLEGWMRRRGSIVLFLLAFVPNPLFDLAGGTAGILKYPIWKFLIVCFLGKTARYMLIAQGISWIL
jgi:membrane protein YqaA with SNARE-associated domain